MVRNLRPDHDRVSSGLMCHGLDLARLTGWIMLLCLTVFYALMLYEIGELDVWFVGILYIPALLLPYAGKAGKRRSSSSPFLDE